MPWFEDDLHPSGWRWERPDADPVTQILPVILPRVPTPYRRQRPAAVAEPGTAELDLQPDVSTTRPTPAVPAQPNPEPSIETPVAEGVPVSLNREPAVFWMSLVAPIVAAVAAFLWVNDPDTQAIVNAAAVAIAGAITAFIVRSDKLLPALTGAAQAVVALVVGLGVHWTPEQQSLLLVPVGIIAGIIVRDRVVAPVPAVDDRTRLAT